MDQHTRELHCSRIIAGYIRYTKDIKICWPTPDDFYEGCEIYREVYNESKFDGIITQVELEYTLMEAGVISPEWRADIKALGKRLETLRIQAYKQFGLSAFKAIKSEIQLIKSDINNLSARQCAFDHLTCEGVATFAKWSWLVENSVYLRDGQKAILTDTHILSLLNFWNQSRLSDDEIREIARTEPWQTYWQANTGNLFDRPSCSLTDEQRRLIVWTKLYDNIRENPECPSEEMLADDDVTDGWMLLQRQERDKKKKSEQIEAGIKSSKIRSSQDVMIKARTKEDAEAIASLNDADGNMFRNMRLNQIDKQGTVDGKDLIDVKAKRLQK